MLLDYFRALFEYNDWANERILRAAEGVSGDQFTAPMPYPYGSLRGTLVHTLNAEWIWRTRWEGSSPTAPLRETDLPSLASIRQRWQEEQAKRRVFLAALKEEDLAHMIHYTRISGPTSAEPLWQLLAHVVNHGTQHRSEAAAMLTQFGRSPGDLDFVIFVRERGKG